MVADMDGGEDKAMWHVEEQGDNKSQERMEK